MDGYMGEVKMFAGNYPPANWAYCQGQTLDINSHQALYSIMGTTFGGNGSTNFMLPDLRGRTPMGSGTGIGLTPRIPGQTGGYEHISLTINNLPPHTHTVKCDMLSDARTASTDPEGRVPAKINGGGLAYGSNLTGGHQMNLDMISAVGEGQPITVMQPWLCINYIICLFGTYPPRS